MRRVLVIVFATVVASALYGQRNGNSPYSRLGLGEVVDNSFVNLRQMGSIGSSYKDMFHVNVNNPASYAHLRSTAFEFGLSAKRSTLRQGNTTSKAIWSGNLNYLSLGMPLQNELNELLDRKRSPYRYGMAFTLAPMTNVAYNIQSTEADSLNGNTIRSYTGKGGLYKFLWGFGVRYKNFSLGSNLGYAFGSIRNERRINFTEVRYGYNNLFTNTYTSRGFLWDIGALYTFQLNEKAIEKNKNTPSKEITLGLRYSNATNLTTTSAINKSGYKVIPGRRIQQVAVDTSGLKGRAKMPLTLGFGVNYRYGNKLLLGVDWKMTNWDSYFNEASGEVKKTLKNTNAVSLGGYYRPKYNSYTSYWNRVYYRFGLFAKTEPVVIKGVQSQHYGVSFGLGLPFVFKRKISHANLGIELGKRGGGTVISETYMRLSLGFTFNDDEWFLKRKYN